MPRYRVTAIQITKFILVIRKEDSTVVESFGPFETEQQARAFYANFSESEEFEKYVPLFRAEWDLTSKSTCGLKEVVVGLENVERIDAWTRIAKVA